ncbi:isochorismatase family protein [Brumicola pallidula]|jgi:nicotinamidase-related amidase|uniref:Isochorismatase family protein n=1 Tax=Brumicola pallidula DSM 14239 = ACAM 615 TaxID=1121922 RepID=K6YSR0_9ALTE|nr:isochorismatase family protein [Glaciecola pallidula]GAC27011.1 isochorismatase family protein [Glaciecola pallidula DSM 14239 = ACAM 615]
MLDRNNTGLIVVDIQGKLSHLVHNSEMMFQNVAKLIKGCTLLELPILVLEQNPEKLGKTATEIRPLLDGYPCIKKYTFDACVSPRFVEQINNVGVQHWLICGIEAHVCVYQTAMGLKQMGKTIELVVDSIASRDDANKHTAITKLLTKDIGITSVEMCLFELMKDCKDDKFKALLDIVR